MKLINSLEELTFFVDQAKKNHKTIGFSPTMGALHEGHLSLIKQSKIENDFSVCSIFVNPTQFNNSDDLKKYPKTLEKDIKLLESINCDILYFPSIETMYPEGLQKKSYDLKGLDKVMEGAFRKGHFDGVVEIVSRLFKQVQPQKAYFGEKDFQQLQIIKLIVELFNYDIQIIGMPILREKSGLAMSSRNQRLNETQKQEASKIYQILQLIDTWILEFSFIEIYKKIEYEFNKTSLKLEYFKICDEKTLQEVHIKENNKKYRAFIAVFCGEIRLIDNLVINFSK